MLDRKWCPNCGNMLYPSGRSGVIRCKPCDSLLGVETLLNQPIAEKKKKKAPVRVAKARKLVAFRLPLDVIQRITDLAEEAEVTNTEAVERLIRASKA